MWAGEATAESFEAAAGETNVTNTEVLATQDTSPVFKYGPNRNLKALNLTDWQLEYNVPRRLGI